MKNLFSFLFPSHLWRGLDKENYILINQNKICANSIIALTDVGEIDAVFVSVSKSIPIALTKSALIDIL